MRRRRVLVIPEYNEARTIIDVLSASEPSVDQIVVINDGSEDESAELVIAWARDLPHVTLINLPANGGKSGAMLCGFAYCYRCMEQGALSPDDLIITIDADGQHEPEEIPKACDYLERHGLDIVLGRRTLKGYPWYKHIGNWGLSLWASLLSGYRYHDVECGFRVMRAAVLPDLLSYYCGRKYSGDQEIGIITAAVGFKVDNRFPVGILYYRAGARIRDGLTNLVMGLMVALRVWLGRRMNQKQRVEAVLRRVEIVQPYTLNSGAGD